jgi:hypothetical protein
VHRLLLLPAALLSGCAVASAQEAPVAGQSGYVCRGEGLERFVGQAATQEIGAEMLRVSGARTLRWVSPGMAVTMDFREDRLTVYLDAANRIERSNCG